MAALTSSTCPMCGLKGCAAPRDGGEAVAPEVLAQVGLAVATPLLWTVSAAPSADGAHPLRVQWTAQPDARTMAGLPLATVYVGHGRARWGNPFDVREYGHDGAATRYRDWLLARPGHIARARRELAGRRLACWCSLRVPCHADVLLEFVNSPAHPTGDVPAPASGPAPAPVRSTPAT